MKLLAFLLLFPLSVMGETYLTTTVASYHMERNDYNEFNYGLGLNKDQYIAGFYRNSHDKTSYYAGYEFIKPMDGYRLGLQTGLLSGYDDAQLKTPSSHGIHLYALPVLILGRDVRYKIGIVPVDNWTVTLQIDWRI